MITSAFVRLTPIVVAFSREDSMSWRSRVVTVSVLLVALAAAGPAHARDGSTATRAAQAAAPGRASATAPQAGPAAKPKKTPAEKAAEPWPDEATLAARRADAEGRRLFQHTDTLAITLAADFPAVNRDRKLNSTKTFPASITMAGDNGTDVTIPVTLKTRGKLRLEPQVCSFVPLGVTFTKKEAAGTEFDGQRTLKLVTHCQNFEDYDQLVLKEYLAYRLFNLLTPKSLRVRLARVTYVDSRDGKRLFTHFGVFIEDEDDLARRIEGRALAFPHTVFANFDVEALTTMMVFQYMIGNTDFSIWGLHNVRMVQTRFRPLYPIVWDFDASGLVFAPYVMPDPRLGLSSLRDRKYRGPCRSLEAFEPTFELFRSKQAESMALFDSVPELREGQREVARHFLAEFYTTLNRKDALKREFVDKCNAKNNTI
jgi:hypothetical protein